MSSRKEASGVGALAILAIVAVIAAILASARPARAESDFQIQVVASPEIAKEKGVPNVITVFWQGLSEQRVLNVTLCQVVPEGRPLLSTLDCFLYTTRYEPAYAAIDLERFSLARRDVVAVFPLLLTTDGVLRKGPVLHFAHVAPTTGDQRPFLEVLPTAASGVGHSMAANGGMGIRWASTPDARFQQISDCRTRWAGGIRPYEVLCQGHHTRPEVEGTGVSAGAYRRQDPHWGFAVGLLGTGELVVSDPVFIDPKWLAEDTTLALRFGIEDEKETYRVGDIIIANVWLTNKGEATPKAPLVSIAVPYRSASLEVLETYNIQEERPPTQPGDSAILLGWLDPRELLPGQEALVARVAFKVTDAPFRFVHIGASGWILGDGIERRFSFERFVQD